MLNESRKRGLDRLAALRDDTNAAGLEMQAERRRIDALRERGPVKAVSAVNLFQTPEPIAAQLVELLELSSSSHVLEPSAGLGRLYRALRGVSDCRVSLVEIASQCAEILYTETATDEAAKLYQRDFLTMQPDDIEPADAVLINPPFKQGRDVKHIKHAMQFLKPGGRLVGLCFDGVKQNRDLRPLVDRWEVLPAGSFKSEGTGASCALIVWNKS